MKLETRRERPKKESEKRFFCRRFSQMAADFWKTGEAAVILNGEFGILDFSREEEGNEKLKRETGRLKLGNQWDLSFSRRSEMSSTKLIASVRVSVVSVKLGSGSSLG